MTAAALGALVGAALAAAVLVALVDRRRRGVAARLDAILATVVDEHRSSADLDSALLALERVAVDLAGDRRAADDDRHRLVAALDALSLGIVVVDAAGTVRHRNRAAEAHETGRLADALVGSTLEEVLGAALRGATGERLLDLYGPPARTVVVRGVPIVEGEVVAGALGVVEDVTERQRLESVRRDFVANISHELRTPIGALGLLADALAEADDPADAARLASRLGGEVERLTRTIEDLLELSRIEGREASTGDDLSVRDVVAEAVDRARPVAAAAAIELVVRPGPDAPVVHGDRRQLVSALFNLLDNAIKYSDPGTAVEVRCDHDGDEVLVAVADRGDGIPAADLERVFERFYRVDAARSRATGGTGLGLAIVRHVAANHGGTVEVRSRAGEGSTFTLRLPATGGAAPTAEVG